MIIETTLHIHKNILAQLDSGAIITGKSRTFIIKCLMQKMMKINRTMLKCSTAIKYQEKDEKGSWHKLHIVLNEYEYEYFLDLRKFYKMSVSFILAYAVREYYNDILNELIDEGVYTDNYRFRNYVFMKEIIDGITCWKIYWGIPEKTTLLRDRERPVL